MNNHQAHQAAEPITLEEWLRKLSGSSELAEMVASNAGIYAHLLRKIQIDETHHDAATLAGDPNTAPQILLRLAGLHPEAFSQNPILPLLLLENPNFLGEMRIDMLMSLMRYEGLPAELLRWIVTHGKPALAAEAGLHVVLAGEADQEWEALSSGALCKALTIGYTELLSEMIELEAVPVWLQAALATHEDPAIQALIAGSAGQSFIKEQPSIIQSSSTPEQDACAEDFSVRAIAAAHPGLSYATLRTLADDPSPKVRAAVVQNPGITHELLAYLAGDDSSLVLRAVAAHPATPPELLERLVYEHSWFNVPVRLAAAQRPDLAPGILELLAGDRSIHIRQAVLRHPNTPASARSQVLDAALGACIHSSEPFYHVIALAHPYMPIETLQINLNSPIWAERYAIARNPSTPEAIHSTLAHDGNRLVRAAARAALQKAL